MSPGSARAELERLYRTDRRRALATLTRLLGGLEPAEEALQEAFAAAAQQWPRDGTPANPFAWLVSAGRFRMIDRWRRLGRMDQAAQELAVLTQTTQEPAPSEPIADDELRLIFTCCHPALPPDARIALTLREVAGLTTEEIARAYLTSAPTIAQRIVRAKAKIRDAALPYEVPAPSELGVRLEGVLQVIYLLFNEGYLAADGSEPIRAVLCDEAVRLGRLLVALLPDPKSLGLLVLMLLHRARQAARLGAGGALVLLEDQDRARWDLGQIAEARRLLARAFAGGEVGTYALQAGIAAVHADALDLEATDWSRILALYDLLLQADPSPVVELNRAAALAMRDGPEAGLAAIAPLAAGELAAYHLAHAAQADLLRRLGRDAAALEAYRRALELCPQPAERGLLERRIAALTP